MLDWLFDAFILLYNETYELKSPEEMMSNWSSNTVEWLDGNS